ncbi:unnamed protein product [Prorocentrum cordatum]|uniref:Tyrosine specific protein phosphatases domain-containing protein n=1 Tax=Prorocentrum cordatum TaxID=2364126 RepID=A0ABN9TIP4_9DINO|nr:unnamed protein product [Polarella glacialis]
MGLSTLIPQRLCYGPIGSGAGDVVRLSFNEITVPEFREGRYGVCHYSEMALGGCVGPLGFDQMLWFCLELDGRLQDPSKLVAVQYVAEERQNVAVVTGAYLVLVQGWSAAELRRALPEDAGLTFPCSWATPRGLKTSQGAPRMTVQDCWEGVQMARDLGWLSKDSVKDGVVAALAASKFWKITCQYDGAWLVPGAIFVMADPMTTIHDPNPATCAAFRRECGDDPELEEASLDDLRGLTKCTAAPPMVLLPPSAVCGDAEGEEEAAPDPLVSTAASERDRDGADDLLAGASVHTVCKAYGAGAGGPKGCGQWPGAKPFVDFLLEEGIGTVVRVNMPDEQGLAEIGGSYDARLLAEHRIRHEDVFVSDSKADSKGAVPPSGVIRRFFRLVGDTSPEGCGAVLVHCKGGFGRSVFMACLLIIYRYDVPGRGLLGWVRIARPGAITTPEQEAALRSITGREDLCRKYGVPCEGPGGAPTGQACCTVS